MSQKSAQCLFEIEATLYTYFPLVPYICLLLNDYLLSSELMPLENHYRKKPN